MYELVDVVGNVRDIAFEFSWERTDLADTSTNATRAALRVLVEGVPVWCGHDSESGFEWTWIELLEFLSYAWPFMTLEDGPPLGLALGTPAEVAGMANDIFNVMPAEIRENAESEFEAYLQTHDLARAVAGAKLPTILITRIGRLMHLATNTREIFVEAGKLLATLTAVGDLIARRLRHLDDGRARAAVTEWDERSASVEHDRVAIATGLAPDELEVIQGNRATADVWELPEDPYELNELLVAARFSGSLEAEEISEVVEFVRTAPPRTSPELDRVAEKARTELASFRDARPFDQGYLLARWLRVELGSLVDDAIDPAVLLKQWAIDVVDVELQASEIDAIACWGPAHGPAVFVNVRGQHASGAAGRRATLAHEVAHLLVDRADFLPLAEVLGGQTPPSIEARARAFAAEVLIPRHIAGAAFEGTDDPASVMTELRRRFGVSSELVAWQAKNSGIPMTAKVRSYLRLQVSRPHLF
jgi:Zn-dependent peptidase ImmA (M78 family)